MAVIVVTGAEGQLGISLKMRAEKKSPHTWLFPTRKQLDITQSHQVRAYFAHHHPTHCINCAAYTNVTKAEVEIAKAKAINTEAVRLLVEVCNAHTTTLVHLSTDYVFDGKKRTPYTEDDPVNPLNVYGKTKAAGEQIVLSKGRRGYVVRTAWLYAKTHGKNFYRSILSKGKAGKPIQIVNDQIGSPTTTDELSLFLMNLIEHSPPYGIYHCSGKQALSWYAFAQKILQENKISVQLEPVSTPKEGIKRPQYSVLTSTKTLFS